MELNVLKKHLWNCAEILCGSAVDRTDWKGYILPLLFFKRISHVWDEETAEAVETYGDTEPTLFPEVSMGSTIRFMDVTTRATLSSMGFGGGGWLLGPVGPTGREGQTSSVVYRKGNEFVYNLSSLTDEEIHIVEETTK